jgi:predicted MFS family arabinose efflux permease
MLGDGIFTVALALEALRVDHHPTGLAYVLASRAIPSILLSILGGVVVDRIPRRTAMLLSDLVRGLAVAVIAILVAGHSIGLLDLIVMAVVFGAADAFGGPASLALIPELIPAELITQANALNSTSAELAVNLVGPALGGLAVATLGEATSFALDAASFAVGIGCLVALRWRQSPKSSGGSLLAEAAEGFRYILTRRWLYLLLGGAAVANLVGAGPFLVLLPVLVRHVLHSSPLTLGLVYSSAGAAGVAASLVVARLGSPRHLLEAMWTAYSLSGLSLVGLSFAPNAWVAAIFSAASAGFVVYGDVLYFSRLQLSVLKNLLGRVSSVSYVMVWTLTPVGMLLGGVLAVAIGTRTTLLLSGILSAACGLVLLVPGSRSVESLPSNG